MPDLTDRLALLNDADHGIADESVVAGDLARGRSALRARRVRVGSGIAIAALAVTTVTSLTYAATGNGSRGTPHAGGPTTHSQVVTHTSAGAHTAATSQRPANTSPAAGSLRLVAYHGKNLPGYTVTRIPEGYVLEGINGSVLSITKPGGAGGDAGLGDFQGKLVVMVNADEKPPTSGGVAVTVNGAPGRILTDDGVASLFYYQGKYSVEVQRWSNIHLTNDQLVQFAEGVTVLPSIQEVRG